MRLQIRIDNSVIYTPETFSLEGSVEGRHVKCTLSHTESKLLTLLCEHAGSVVERKTIYDTVWPNMDIAENNLNKTIMLIRKRFSSDFLIEGVIDTVPRVGYLISKNVIYVQAPLLAPAEKPSKVQVKKTLPIVLCGIVITGFFYLFPPIFMQKNKAVAPRDINLGDDVHVISTRENDKGLNDLIVKSVREFRPVYIGLSDAIVSFVIYDKYKKVRKNIIFSHKKNTVDFFNDFSQKREIILSALHDEEVFLLDKKNKYYISPNKTEIGPEKNQPANVYSMNYNFIFCPSDVASLKQCAFKRLYTDQIKSTNSSWLYDSLSEVIDYKGNVLVESRYKGVVNGSVSSGSGTLELYANDIILSSVNNDNKRAFSMLMDYKGEQHVDISYHQVKDDLYFFSVYGGIVVSVARQKLDDK